MEFRELTKEEKLKVYKEALSQAQLDLRVSRDSQQSLDGLCQITKYIVIQAIGLVEYNKSVDFMGQECTMLRYLPELKDYRPSKATVWWWSTRPRGPYCKKRINILKEIIWKLETQRP